MVSSDIRHTTILHPFSCVGDAFVNSAASLNACDSMRLLRMCLRHAERAAAMWRAACLRFVCYQQEVSYRRRSNILFSRYCALIVSKRIHVVHFEFSLFSRSQFYVKRNLFSSCLSRLRHRCSDSDCRQTTKTGAIFWPNRYDKTTKLFLSKIEKNEKKI